MIILFVEHHDVSLKICVNANNNVSHVKGRVVAKTFSLDKRGISHVLNLIDCLYVLGHSRKLLNVNALGQKYAKVVFDDICELRCPDKVSLPFVQSNDLYVTKLFPLCSSIFSSTLGADVDLLRCRLCHKKAKFKNYQSRLKE